MNGVHVMYESLHSLMDTSHSVIDSMLHETVITLQSVKILMKIILYLHIVKMRQVFADKPADIVYLFDIAAAYIGSQIEVERGDRLASMHLVLRCLKRDAGNHARGLDAFCRT